MQRADGCFMKALLAANIMMIFKRNVMKNFINKNKTREFNLSLEDKSLCNFRIYTIILADITNVISDQIF